MINNNFKQFNHNNINLILIRNVTLFMELIGFPIAPNKFEFLFQNINKLNFISHSKTYWFAV